MLQVRPHISAVIPLLGMAIFVAGCSSKPTSGVSTEAEVAAASDGGGHAAALADLQASAKWTGPRCRWLETGAWIVAYPQETALYRAASDLGYIEMTEAGQANRTGVPQSAWRIALTDAGKVEAAKCTGSSRRAVFGVPVSQRKFIAGKFVESEPYGRTVYEVEYAWVPTGVGERVLGVLTDKMAVEEGTYRTKVYLRKGRAANTAAGNGWVVDAIDDLGAVRLR